MKTPLAWEYDLAEVLDIQSVLALAIASGYGLVNMKHRLRDARDRLGTFVDALADNGADAAHEEAYLHLFDALSYLTEAVRGPAVHRGHLDRAFKEISGVFELDLSV